jgi:hypothetical protein
MAELKSLKITSATVKATIKLDEKEAAKLIDPSKVQDLVQVLDLKALPEPTKHEGFPLNSFVQEVDQRADDDLSDFARRANHLDNGVDQRIDFEKDGRQQN